MTREYTEEINSISTQKTDLSTDNNILHGKIAQIDELVKEAKNEYKTVNKYIETQRYPRADRRTLLRDVEYITIDEKGNPHIQFKSLSSMNTIMLNMGIEIEKYSELDEAGWEDELKEAEKYEDDAKKKE